MGVYMKKVIACVVALGLSSAALAESSHEKAVNQLFKAINVSALVDKTQDAVLESQLKNDPCLEPFKGVIRDFYHKEMGWSAFEPKMRALYMKEFSEDEIKQMAAFYESPVGQKALKKAPDLMIESVTIGYELSGQKEGELKRVIEEAQMNADPNVLPEQCRIVSNKVAN